MTIAETAGGASLDPREAAPLVCRLEDAIEAFYATPLDALAIGGFVLRKPGAGR